MRSLKLLSCLVVVGSVLLLAAPANADQILLGGSNSSLGTVTISCPGGQAACTMSLVPSGSLSSGSGLDSSFNSPNDSTVFSTGDYTFNGGSNPTNTLTSSNGVVFAMSGNSWAFNFTDTLGNSLSADADWSTFFNASPIGFQVGQLDFNTISCSGPTAQFCSDFSHGGSIDITFKGITTDLSTLWTRGGTDSGISIEGGSVNPSPVPEPGTLALFGSGLIGLAGYARRRFGKV